MVLYLRLFSGEAQRRYENMSSLLLRFYSPHYIENHRNGGRGKIERRKREDPGNEADLVVPNEIKK